LGCTDSFIAKNCHSAEVAAKMEADNMCQISSGTPGSESCHCNGQYSTLECNVIYKPDHTCQVISKYEYSGVCDDQTLAPTAAPTIPLPCPDKECSGQNPVHVLKVKGKCNAAILNKFCLESKIKAKMEADLECNLEDQCLCKGKYSLARCYRISVNQGSVTSVQKPYCYYYAKYTYEGKCAMASMTYPGIDS
jgi:hypothetical protein